MEPVVDLRPFKRLDQRMNKWYSPIVRIGTLPGKVRTLHRIFKTATEATGYARKVIARLEVRCAHDKASS